MSRRREREEREAFNRGQIAGIEEAIRELNHGLWWHFRSRLSRWLTRLAVRVMP